MGSLLDNHPLPRIESMISQVTLFGIILGASKWALFHFVSFELRWGFKHWSHSFWALRPWCRVEGALIRCDLLKVRELDSIIISFWPRVHCFMTNRSLMISEVFVGLVLQRLWEDSFGAEITWRVFLKSRITLHKTHFIKHFVPRLALNLSISLNSSVYSAWLSICALVSSSWLFAWFLDLAFFIIKGFTLIHDFVSFPLSFFRDSIDWFGFFQKSHSLTLFTFN